MARPDRLKALSDQIDAGVQMLLPNQDIGMLTGLTFAPDGTMALIGTAKKGA